jgi:uncharacterized membrane protein
MLASDRRFGPVRSGVVYRDGTLIVDHQPPGLEKNRVSEIVLRTDEVVHLVANHLTDLSADLAGVENIGSDLATFIRTVVVLISFLVLLLATGQFATPGPILPRTWTFLILSGLGTGASWLCYFRALKLGPASMVAPIDKLSVALLPSHSWESVPQQQDGSASV